MLIQPFKRPFCTWIQSVSQLRTLNVCPSVRSQQRYRFSKV